ncbi:MAG: hypothetical protein EBQ71_05595 [Betaproteobacteria bacterium]|nr:hypothetical protein [Betaproteobacteria bacterium]
MQPSRFESNARAKPPPKSAANCRSFSGRSPPDHGFVLATAAMLRLAKLFDFPSTTGASI